MNTPRNDHRYWVVGLGRVGSLMARVIDEQGQLHGITVRKEEDLARAHRFSENVQKTLEPPERLPENCVVLLCVPDAAVLGVSALWAGRGAVAYVHFSGALGVEAVQEQVRSQDVAALHPLLSVSSDDMSSSYAQGVTFGLSAGGNARAVAVQIAQRFGRSVVRSEERRVGK